MKYRFLTLLLTAFTAIVAANGGHGHASSSAQSSGLLFNPVPLVNASGTILLVSLGLLVLLSAIAVLLKDRISEPRKKLLFGTMVFVVVVPTLLVFSSVLYLNAISYTNGAAHWHADFTIYVNGSEVKLEEPHGLSDRVGSAKAHTHDDKRIHFEGVFKDKEDVELHSFFEPLGGELTQEHFVIPTHDGKMHVENTQKKKWKVFVLRGQQGEREWSQLENYPEYVISPYGTIPPGDRLVFIYTNKTTQEILEDLKEDNKYDG